MLKLKVINFKRESRNRLIKIFCIFVLVIFVFNLISNLKFDLKMDKDIDKKKLNTKNYFDIDFYEILKKCFVFYDIDLLNFNISDNNNCCNKLSVLKSKIELLGYFEEIDKDINDDVLLNENIEYELKDEKIVETVSLNNNNETLIENVIDLEKLSNKDKVLLNSNYVYIPKYEISAKNSKDIFDIDLNEIAKNIVTTEVQEKNREDKFNTKIGNVKIRNESKYPIEQSMLDLKFKLKDKKNITIYHTHTCESYTASERYNYTQTGNYRSVDLSYSVSRVGDVLEHFLKKLNYNVVHSKTYHDYPAYNGSYNRALVTVNNLLKNNNSDIVIDLHRDAIGNNSDYGPTIKIGDDKVAELMFVIGTDGGGLKHENWKQNLKFAIEVQELSEKMYPGLFKPIIVRNARYNQHVSNGAVIIEVGATGNTLDEAEGAMKYLAIILDEYIKQN